MYAKPPIWRRLVLPGDLVLDELHDVLQVAMGWQDGHLHKFGVGADRRTTHRGRCQPGAPRGKGPSPSPPRAVPRR
ncbi:plasmid pRiA4b ORF-3 family protein [Mycobacteroides abscessus]|uniref:plasmid pRiA4b ORF-3 family protein n=1 Tax=Mycobacteroides abscessus TaxID=36809 RepID=UPI001F46D60C|nr:plasmid pRiA4b ORF-3 family protein [Mycobacteroides abscessus]